MSRAEFIAELSAKLRVAWVVFDAADAVAAAVQVADELEKSGEAPWSAMNQRPPECALPIREGR
jgi:hypothetical protein